MADNAIIYDNRVLTKVVLGIAPKRNFFKDTFFSNEIQSSTDTIQLDIDTIGNGTVPFVSPMSEGSLMNKQGYSTNILRTAYIAPYINITPQDFMYRMAGQNPFNNTTPEMEVITRHLVNLKRAVENTEELMCANAVINGKFIYDYKVGETVKQQEIDFGRKAEHTIALTGTNQWGNTDSDVLKNIREWRSLILKNGYNAQADVLVLGSKAAALFFKDENVKELYSSSKYGITKMEVSSDMPGLYRYGYIPGIGEVYEYERYYDKDGKTVNMIAENAFVYGASNAGNFMGYGAIQNFDANAGNGLLPVKMYASYMNKDSKNKKVMVESSPLPCLANANCIVAGKITEA